MEQDFVSRIEGDVLLVKVDLAVYTLDAVLKTAYWFTDKCYLHVQHASPIILEVRFKAKKGEASSGLAEDFMNHLLDQTLRERVSIATEPLRNLVIAHALSKTCLIAPEFESTAISQDPVGASIPDDSKHN